MISGGSSSGVAVAVQALCQEAGIIFMAGLTHANDTTGKDKKANGFRHFFNSYMSAAALAPILAKEYGNERKAYHLTAPPPPPPPPPTTTGAIQPSRRCVNRPKLSAGKP